MEVTHLPHTLVTQSLVIPLLGPEVRMGFRTVITLHTLTECVDGI